MYGSRWHSPWDNAAKDWYPFWSPGMAVHSSASCFREYGCLGIRYLCATSLISCFVYCRPENGSMFLFDRSKVICLGGTCNNNNNYYSSFHDEAVCLNLLNSPAKFFLFPERALPLHNNPPVILQYFSATPVLNENPAYPELSWGGTLIWKQAAQGCSLETTPGACWENLQQGILNSEHQYIILLLWVF